MCIAVYKPYESPPIKKRIFKNCWDNNDDGAGYAWWDAEAKIWHLRKGFMTWKAWWKSFNSHQFKDDSKYIAHFRVGTSGVKNGPTCTHPFPVSKEPKHLEATAIDTYSVAMHNGVVGQGEGNLSDTMVYVRDYAAVLWKYAQKDESVEDLLCGLLKYDTNRWLLAYGEQVMLYGDWDEDKEMGAWFSNSGYQDSYRNWQQTHNRRYVNGKYEYTKKPENTDVVMVYTSFVPGKYYDDNNQWSWDTYFALDLKQENTEDVEVVVAHEDGQCEVINLHTHSQEPGTPTVVGLVDDHGNILWDEGYDSRDDLPLCPNCKSADNLLECDPATIPIADIDPEDLLFCGRCGANFRHESGDTIFWNLEIKADYEEAMKSHG
jgi:hypothetical protein